MPEPTYKVLVDWDDDGNFTGTYDDVTNDVVGQVVIDRGRSDVHGSLSIGSLGFTLNNKSKKYSPKNTSSPIYGKVLPYRKVQIQVVYDSVTYYRFTGRVISYKPSPDRVNPTVQIYCEDNLSQLEQQNITKFLPSLTTYDDIVAGVLAQAGLSPSEYDIDTIPDEITTSHGWTETGVVEILREVAEAGHHFFFMDGQGVLNFKFRHWALNSAAVETYYTDEDHSKTLSRPSDMDWDDKDVVNDIIVRHTVDKTASDTTSQSKYGVRSHVINNETVKHSDASQAQNLADYWMELYREIVWLGAVVIKNLFPDVVEIEPGKVVVIVDDQLDLNTRFIVMGINETIEVLTGNHMLTMRVQEEVDITFVGLKATYPVGALTYRYAYDTTHTFDHISGFGRTITQQIEGKRGLIGTLDLYLKGNWVPAVSGNYTFDAELRELDGNGKPVGTLVSSDTLIKNLGNSAVLASLVVGLSGMDEGEDYGVLIRPSTTSEDSDTELQGSQDGSVKFGDVTVRARVAQVFDTYSFVDLATGFLLFDQLSVYMRRISNPGSFRFALCKRLSSGDPDHDNPVATSPWTSVGTEWAIKNWTINRILENIAYGYAIFVELSGSPDVSNYYQLQTKTSNPYALGKAMSYDSVGAAWSDLTNTRDLRFELDWKKDVRVLSVAIGPDPYSNPPYASYPDGSMVWQQVGANPADYIIDTTKDLYFELKGW